jgi:hypothetical protein
MLDRTADRALIGANINPLWIGLHWPSLPFGDEELGGACFDTNESGAPSPAELVQLYVDCLALGEASRPLIQQIVDAHVSDAAPTTLPRHVVDAYDKFAAMAGRRGGGPSGPPDADGTPFDPAKGFDAENELARGSDFGGLGGFLGGILAPLRQFPYWTMKKRARTIGESGMHEFVAALMSAAPNTRFHLMGHSFGCIVVSSILGGPGAAHALPRAVDSAVLVQGALSLWSYADSIPAESGSGYYNPIPHRQTVRGPVVVTRSIHDRAVGIFYPLASAAVFANPSFDIDSDEFPKYGGIGSFGIQGLPDLVNLSMLDENRPYQFRPGKIYNLEASQFIAKGGGPSGAHCDIDAHALWQAALV